MKIAFVHHTFIKGSGIEQVTLNLAKCLSTENEVTIYTYHNEYDDHQAVPIIEAKLPFSQHRIVTSILSPLFIYQVKNLRKELKNYDAVVTQLYPANLLPLLPTKLENKAVYIEWGLQPLTAFPGRKERAYIKLLEITHKYAIKHSDIVLVANRETKEWVNQLGTKSIQMYLYGIDFEYHKPTPANRILSQYPMLKESKIIIFIGRCVPHKNIHLLIQSFLLVKKKVPEAKLVLVGRTDLDPEYYHGLLALVEELKLDNDVIFTGLVSEEDIPKYYTLCDIFANASSWEGYLNPEPLAYGKPIVAYNAPAHRDTIYQQGHNGFLINELSPKAFAKGILKALHDWGPEQSNQTISWAKEHLTYSTIAKNILQEIRK